MLSERRPKDPWFKPAVILWLIVFALIAANMMITGGWGTMTSLIQGKMTLIQLLTIPPVTGQTAIWTKNIGEAIMAFFILAGLVSALSVDWNWRHII